MIWTMSLNAVSKGENLFCIILDLTLLFIIKFVIEHRANAKCSWSRAGRGECTSIDVLRAERAESGGSFAGDGTAQSGHDKPWLQPEWDGAVAEGSHSESSHLNSFHDDILAVHAASSHSHLNIHLPLLLESANVH